MESGTYSPSVKRTAYVWKADEEMPDGFKPVDKTRQDEAVKWDDDTDQPERTPDGSAVTLHRGSVLVVGPDGNIEESFELDDEDAVKSFARRYEIDADELSADSDTPEVDDTSAVDVKPEDPSRPLDESEREELTRLRSGVR